ncbi:unnamed protein product [Urochloa decumbens]|uniref:Uncharacterized protein n=1 Tax=Urochloa decumbens TaxID=240449 RepID=A0ABC9GMV9_9POAL
MSAISAERKEREAILKTYWDERRRTARERMLSFAELGEADRKRGHLPALPPLEILNFTDLLGRAWGWDSLMPCSSLHYWLQYKKYLHDYYDHNISKVNDDLNLNGDDGNGLAALADSCIMMEHELESMMMRRPKVSNDRELSLSCKITRCAHEISKMKCSDFPAAAVALKCITKEADLMCQLLVCGCTASALIFCGRIREHALSFMTLKGPEHVAAAATMMGATKEANLICELLKNGLDGHGSELLWSKTIRDGALRAMIKISDEYSAEDSTMGSIVEKNVSGESDDKNCSKDELVQDDNVKETEKINQKIKEDGVEGNYLDKSVEQMMEVKSVNEDS